MLWAAVGGYRLAQNQALPAGQSAQCQADQWTYSFNTQGQQEQVCSASLQDDIFEQFNFKRGMEHNYLSFFQLNFFSAYLVNQYRYVENNVASS